jgi:hypothetical protein
MNAKVRVIHLGTEADDELRKAKMELKEFENVIFKRTPNGTEIRIKQDIDYAYVSKKVIYEMDENVVVIDYISYARVDDELHKFVVEREPDHDNIFFDWDWFVVSAKKIPIEKEILEEIGKEDIHCIFDSTDENCDLRKFVSEISMHPWLVNLRPKYELLDVDYIRDNGLSNLQEIPDMLQKRKEERRITRNKVKNLCVDNFQGGKYISMIVAKYL